VSERSELYARLPLLEPDRWWLEQTVNAPNCRVLELGAGTGRLARAFVDLGCEVTAVEADEDMLASLTEQLGDEVQVLAADVTDLPDEVGDGYGLVALPSSLLNEISDAEARRRLMVNAAARCHPEGRVAMQLLGPWWLVGLPGRSTGRLHPADGSAAIDVTIETMGFDPWTGQREARLTYRFGDGTVLHDALVASAVTPAEIGLLLRAAGLELVGKWGAIPPDSPRTHDPVWHLAARPAAA